MKKLAIVVSALILFGCGFLVGFWARPTATGPLEGGWAVAGDGAPATDASARRPRGESRGRPAKWPRREGERDRPESARGREGDRDGEDDASDEREGRRGAGEIMAAIETAILENDEHELHDALRDLIKPGGPALSPEQVERLGALLPDADRELIGDVAAALAMAGGAEGLALVLDFAENGEQPLEDRQHALEGLGRIPREKAADLLPGLTAFLETGPAEELQRATAGAIGRMHGDEGAAVLLDFLDSTPGLRSDTIFDAISEVGTEADVATLLERVPAAGNHRDKMHVLHAAARISARDGNPEAVLGMLRSPPPGVSKEMAAHAIAEVARNLDTTTLLQALKETGGDQEAQEPIARALAHVGGQKGIELLKQAMADPEFSLDRRALAHAMEDVGGREALPLMMDLFRGPSSGGAARLDEDALHRLARGMMRNGDRATTEQLLGFLEGGGSREQRRAIAHSLEEGSASLIGSERLLAALKRESDPEVAMPIAWSLAELYPDSVQRQQVFLDLAGSGKSPRVRVEAVEHLAHRIFREGRAGNTAGVAQLEQLIASEPDAEVREHMQDVVEEMRERRR